MASKQLAVLIPAESFATSAGTITLKPFKFKQLNEALELVDKYLQIISNPELTTDQMISALLQKQEEGYAVMDDIAKLITLVSGVSELDDFGYDEVICLLTEILQMNMDFFTAISKRLNPKKAEASGEEAAPAKTGD
ncbi:hypothetical protein H6G45_09250 [Synechocystis sp. FACHB-383]|jgi:hypothetical protein|uniref:hypothetical protein n=1 Tax=Synechocystis sp. FACHB-383 TaxID=2692864 RepID=UPI0016842F20|nr:hypothetical protein [Synechocystis sp. FACHB-383]MBD2653672.1 hypothetical protein [Synechocystis sp. FACHB-383]